MIKNIIDIAKSLLKKLVDNTIVVIRTTKIHLNDELKEVFKMEGAEARNSMNDFVNYYLKMFLIMNN